MQSEDQRKKSAALVQTVLICIAVDAMFLLLLRAIFGTFAEALFISLLVIGPVTFWLSAPLYRYLQRANKNA